MAAVSLGLAGCGDNVVEADPDVFVDVDGLYLDQVGDPISAAAVELLVGSAAPISRTTDSSGAFSFTVKNPTASSGTLNFTRT